MRFISTLFNLLLIALLVLGTAACTVTPNGAATDASRDASSGAASARSAKSTTDALNILLLFADDLGYGDLSSYGHPNIHTPNLDALAATGQRWTDFYVAAPVCSPSRGALLTSRLPTRTGLYGERIPVLFPDDTQGMPDSETTLGEVLQQAGYASAVLGKWHLGDDPAVYPTRHGFDYWFGLPYSNDMDWVGTFTFGERLVAMASGKGLTAAQQAESDGRRAKYANPKLDYWNVPLIRSAATSGEDGKVAYTDRVVERPAQQPTLTQRYTEEALAFIDRNPDKPFFVYVPYTMPHTPLFASANYQGKSRGGVYGDVVEEIDGSVGQLLAGLEARGMRDNTLVIFTSDNGPWLAMLQNGGSAGLLRMGKGTTFEGGMRVPAIFSQPGTVAPGQVHAIGSALDIMPTVLAMAGLGMPDGVITDGMDISEVLTRRAAGPRSNLPYYRAGELRAWRQGDWKLHLIIEGAYGEGPKHQVLEEPTLYHLGRDPGERFDVAAQHPDVVAAIQAAIAEHKAQLTTQPPLFDARLATAAELAKE